MNSITARNYKKKANNATRKLFRGGEEMKKDSRAGVDIDEVKEVPADEEDEEEEIGTNTISEQVQEPVANEVQEPAANEVQEPAEPAANEVKEPAANEVQEPAEPAANEVQEPAANEVQEPAEPAANEVQEGPAAKEVQEPAAKEVQEETETTAQIEGETIEIQAFRNTIGNPEIQRVYFYMNTNISTEENRDKSYKREGVLHFTDSVSVGSSQNTIMSLGTVIGNRGIETSTYDKLRNVALQKVGILLGETRRCYNTKIDFERNGETIFVHIYGTIYSKKESTV
jgi:hypothetical protein